LQLSRKRTPTDKSPIEAAFNYVKDHWCARLSGFKGADLQSRGKQIESDAFYFISELEQMFAQWVATKWQQRIHQGLQIPGAPQVKLSPNDMYAEGIAKAGFVYAVPDASVYYELLPTAWLTVTDAGVTHSGLQYDHHQLAGYRNTPSVYGGIKPGKYPVRYDERNLEEVYFFDYQATPKQWLVLRWRHAVKTPQPFSTNTLAYVKSLCVQRLLDPRDPRELAKVLREVLTRWDEQYIYNQKERKLLIRQALHLKSAQRDRNRFQTNTEMLTAPDEAADMPILDGELTDNVDWDYDETDLLMIGGHDVV
jgi:putative transposase